MFKWKVSGLGGGGSKKNKSASAGTKLNNNNQNNNNQIQQLESVKNNKNKEQQQQSNNKKDLDVVRSQNLDNKIVGELGASENDAQLPQQRSIRSFFGVGGSVQPHGNTQSNGIAAPSSQTGNGRPSNNSTQNQHPPSSSNLGLQDPIFNTRIGSRLAGMHNNPPMPQQQSNQRRNPPSRLNLSTEHIYSSSNNNQERLNSSFQHHTASGNPPPPVKPGWRQRSAADLESALPNDSLYSPEDNNKFGKMSNGLAHWSSHGYLSKATENEGFVSLKKGQQQQQPLSLPPNVSNEEEGGGGGGGERKYFSVRGLSDMRTKHVADNDNTEVSKYYSVDARYSGDKNLPIDVRNKLKEQFRAQQYPPYPAPPPPPPRTEPNNKSNLQSSKGLGGSVSWLEWTQQLQAYVAWVNSQLRKRPDLKPVQDLRCDLQSGEVLAQLIEIISGEKIAGIQYNPESLQGMRENLDRILQFMLSKRIRMHQITSKEILEGNLKAVMRLILALAAHYKPQSVRHHEQSSNQRTKDVPPQNQECKNSATTVATGINSPLNQTQESLNESLARTTDRPRALETSSSSSSSPGVGSSGIKRTPSLNESHYSYSSKDRLGPDPEPSQIYENLSSSTETEKQIVEEAMATAMTQTDAESPLRPSLRKEGSFVRTGSGRKLPMIPPENKKETKPVDNRKSKPKALEFWESMEETMDRGDFRYNTIHRMSMGRRMLPKPPPSMTHRSHSLDRSVSGADIRSYEEDKLYSLDSNGYSDKKSSEDSSFASPASPRKKIPADGCSLQSGGSSGDGTGQEESASSSSSRGEIEGSSDHHASPPTSVIGNSEPDSSQSWETSNKPWTSYRQGSERRKWSASPVGQEYLKELNSEKYSPKYPCRAGDGRQSECSSVEDNSPQHQIPYDVLLQDLTQAKRQLVELHSLENVSSFDITKKQPVIGRQSDSDLMQMKQNLVRTTLVKQNLEFEKNELMRKIEDLEKEVSGVKSDVSERDKLIQRLKQQSYNGCGGKVSDQELRSFYDEELTFAKDAIANLRTSFNEADPNQHILDTLEQCISVIVEKIQSFDFGDKKSYRAPPPPPPSNKNFYPPKASPPAGEGISTQSKPAGVTSPTTKILYFTNKSVTPFMSTIPKRIGEIVLRDFKNIFDRPGFYRYHFKTMDQEFGMVKEEISNDDVVLPGTDGKIVVWVEED